jgi:predicted AAA+ superfamily ATPase
VRLDRPEVLFWRTAAGEEVEFVVELGDRLLPVEVKARRRPRTGDLRGLKAFQADYGDAVQGGLLLHDGEEVSWLSEGVLGAPWWRVI